MKSASFITRFFALLLVALCIVMTVATPDAEAKKRTRVSKRSSVASTASGVSDPRYAALIMNPVTGEIYHQQNADGRRYPASLTKMMTLYLLFEALDKGKTTLGARMDVSELAARQPQTNLSLSAGDTIEVETAIKALVVRSANDVAVVVGEALGGDVDHFAQMMTTKARALGMNGTTFQNPNGLPNSGQFTTARDMAKLGIALKRDFPKYYPYFSTLQFSHDGVTYYTHNRVMLRYAGVDGIKTGFVGASGFNLVTSVVRGGRPLVGVVMGGSTGAWRDNRMIALLDQTYGVIANRGAERGKASPANLPLPKAGSKKAGGVGVAVDAEGSAPSAAAVASIAAMDAGSSPDVADSDDASLAETQAVEATSPFAAAGMAPVAAAVAPVVQPKPVAPAPKPAPAVRVVTPSAVQVTKVAPAAPAPAPVIPAPAPVAVAPAPIQLANPPAGKGDFGWGIQVGAFSSNELAQQASQAALQTAARQLVGARVAVVGPASSGVAVHRARIENISQIQAKKACEALISNHSPCFIFKSAQ